MIVVDASLAVKWLLWEIDTPGALAFLKAYGRELAAPELIFIEVAGVIVRRGNQYKHLQPDALRALDKWTIAWSDHVVKHYRVTQRRLFNASSMALTMGHPLKDCIYLALAKELGVELATCDAKFRDKASSLYPRIRLLVDYSLSTSE
ncbi:type II toxin-antitoxin system VapC family toxin [Sphingosinicella sp. LHD-64]|uniref:type II toxin-antitoxin system VapC family toxin n=1 Tax=Sphingosinicella sp. LHD-64 TaxID=3072139 RepID=UPI00280DC065|nr:type II toxin-antitoxin system VapC family toxin [Sphingosinicella sp. LHD-64]MDQ8756646.1 type II toxin-antitoxin system VapC family toxin [Sphingosinicella sp. LHD-64]